MEKSYFGEITATEKINSNQFKLHFHENYEIYMFLEGDVDYIVEGRTYPLKKYDVILISPGEMHRAFHKSDKFYKRVVFNADRSFFEGDREKYLSVFDNREFGTKNKIPAELTRNSGLLDAINRWSVYTENGKFLHSAIGRCVFTEILHILNTLSPGEGQANLISNVIFYINGNYEKKITLDELCERFFVSKGHLCRAFKKSTGYTVTAYINNKRIAKTKELCIKGMSMENACTEAGFSSYCAFYKAYRSQYGLSPKSMLEI